MMRTKITVILLFVSSIIYGQTNIRESVFTHLSGNDFIVGETLYFSPYVYSNQTGKLSNLSKLLYVQLIKSNGESVYQSKILLEGGTGEGAYFIPTDLETGTYHLVSYTRWMKNFESFSEQSIRVINPYLAQKFEKVPETNINVRFSVEGGKMILNKKNRVVLRVTDQFGNGVYSKGKVVSKPGGEVIEVLTDNHGFFGFDLTPKSNVDYHFILELENQFEFFDLPKAIDKGLTMNVIDTGGSFVFKIIAGSADNYTQGVLKILSRNRKDIVQMMTANTAFSIQKSSLSEGLIYASFSVADVITTDRIIWNGKRQKSNSNFLGSFNTMSKAKKVFEIPDSCILSIVVEKVKNINDVENISINLDWKSQLSVSLPNEYYSSASLEQLDNMLIACSWLEKNSQPDTIKYLPELRSGLVQGNVFDSLRRPVYNVPISLSISGVHRQLGTTRTNRAGNFVIPYDPKSQLEFATIQEYNVNANLAIEVEPEFYQSFDSFNDRPIVFDSLLVKETIERSIQNQINNAYSDTSVAVSWPSQSEQFYGIKTYRLDEFTRFSTIRDTFIELIAEVGVSKNEENYDFKIRTQESSAGLFGDNPSLLLLDGGFVKSEDLMKLSPYLVDRIEVLNKSYYFGKTVFDGIVSVVTYKGDRGEVKLMGQRVNITPVQNSNLKEEKSLTMNHNDNRPYFQDLLFWESNIQHSGGNLEIEWRTSEIKGFYELRMEGISVMGKPISRTAYFEVK